MTHFYPQAERFLCGTVVNLSELMCQFWMRINISEKLADQYGQCQSIMIGEDLKRARNHCCKANNDGSRYCLPS